MNENFDKRKSALSAAIFMFLFYAGIMLYVLFAVVHLDTLQNCVYGLVFQIIGFVLLFMVIRNLIGKVIKTGYLIPTILCSVIYSILLDILNVLGAANIPSVFFILAHLILLFVYLLVVMPMLVMGRR